MKKEVKDSLQASVFWFGVFVIMLICSIITGIDGIFCFIGMFGLVAGIICLVAGLIEHFANTTKPRYKKTDDKEFLEKASKIEEECNNNIQPLQELINKNTQDKDELVATMEAKIDEKDKVDSIINSFIEKNVIKIGKGLKVNMINDTIEYYSTIIKMEDITGVQVQCNSKIVTESNTVEQRKARKGLVSTVGRATVGAALVGPAGAVLGLTGSKKTKGTSSTTTTQKEVNSYTVVILTNSIKDSVVTITCGDSEVEAIRINNAINNACLNIGALDTEEHQANLQVSAKLGEEIQVLKDKIKALNEEIKELSKNIKELNKQCNKKIKQLRKELKSK